ncbi:hypothetical protein [Streptomyces sp. B1I3]|uniref:hypothetical protein n=1 Tax=Streptomyces sp. B1I3 TaxID=3042264 RepID=UPI00277E9C37|nr:hypothetical protein [Streptomyces sp. B1I3]MDQ0791955.1 hypothetical protein [Streptomyces sp. B1I3]
MSMVEASGAALAAALVTAAQTAGAADPSVRGSDWRTGTVTAVPGDGTVAVGVIQARCLDSYSGPAVGDQVVISQSGAGNWVALGRLSTSMLGIGQAAFARKTVSTTRTSTATATADPHLVIPVGANAAYEISGLIMYNSTALTGDAKMSITGPTGSSGSWGTYSPSTSATAEPSTVRPIAQDLGTERTYGAGWSTAHGIFLIHGLIVTSATAGTASVNWSQAAADPAGLTFYLNSYMSLTRRA